MRNSTALACFLSAMMVGGAVAQCPTAPRRCRSMVPAQSCGLNYSVARPCVSYPVVQSITNTPAQCCSVLPQAAVTCRSASAQSVTPGIVQNNCKCRSGSVSPQVYPQAASVLDNQRNPFSLAGHAREGQAVYHCQQEFLRCCENGGQNCMSSYITCAQITGEPLKHSACPVATPTIEEKSPNKTLKNP
jgi:hypothetical protein